MLSHDKLLTNIIIILLKDDWNPDWQSTSSSKVAYLVDRLKEIQEANRMIITSNEDKIVETASVSHVHAGINNFSTFSSQQYLVGPSNNFCNKIPQKVIIFSQFLEHIHVIEQQVMVVHCGHFCLIFIIII